MILSPKQIKRSSLFVGLFVLIILGLHLIHQSVFRNEQNSKFGRVFNLKNKTFDYIFLGNSRTLINAQVDTLNTITKLKGYNLGLDGSNALHQYLLLNSFLKNNNKTRVLFFNIDPWGVQLKLTNKQRIYGFLPHIDDDTIYTHLKNNFGNRAWLWRNVPYFKYIEFNSRLGIIPLINNISGTYKDPINSSGDHILTNKKSMKEAEAQKPERILIRPENIHYLKLIHDLCVSHHIKFVAYTSPVIPVYYNRYTNIDSVNQYLQSELQSPYYNFCDSSICKETQNDQCQQNQNSVCLR
ncbi:MAG: hypothetical protein HYZ42_14840 [Bacteroidetes bacterium]|nr:hypothetical protein [Bacteroidota bacterium]